MELPLPRRAAAAFVPGFFGKLPSRGDFVGRGLSAATVAALDSWICQSLAMSREDLAEDWAAAWAVAPIWHFSMAAGQCGPYGLSGLFSPSHDRVGRPFPLILATEMPPDAQGETDEARGAYHEALERACRLALTEALTPDALSAELRQIAAPRALPPALGTWWRKETETVAAAAFDCGTLPDQAQFRRMLTE